MSAAQKATKEVKKLINNVCLAGMCVSAAFIVFISLYARFANIDASETRLLVMYWRELSVVLAALFTCLIGYKATE
jgi:formate/nitrite transporter FocA (FNT family)